MKAEPVNPEQKIMCGTSGCDSPAKHVKIDAQGNRTNMCDDHFPRCRACKFFSANDDDGGECRINPPVVIGLGDGGVATYFPDVNPAVDWCGQFKSARGA